MGNADAMTKPAGTESEQADPWFIYMIRGVDNSLYTGITRDVMRRFNEHCGGGSKAAKSLKGKAPLRLVFTAELADRSQALQMEYRIKRLPKMAKEQLVAGDISIGSWF